MDGIVWPSPLPLELRTTAGSPGLRITSFWADTGCTSAQGQVLFQVSGHSCERRCSLQERTDIEAHENKTPEFLISVVFTMKFCGCGVPAGEDNLLLLSRALLTDGESWNQTNWVPNLSSGGCGCACGHLALCLLISRGSWMSPKSR